MTTPAETREKGEAARRTWKRRGVFAAVAAVVAGFLAKVTEQPVETADGGNVVLGASNSETIVTTITNGATAGPFALQLVATGGAGGTGLFAEATEVGVEGVLFGPSASGAGVMGLAVSSGGYGVWGTNTTGEGVHGESSSGIGVRGVSTSNYAVFGQIPSSSSVSTIGIIAQNSSTYTGSAPGAGGFGIYGVSALGHGVVGAAATAGAAAVVGATNGVAGAYAGVFYGPVSVGGTFTVFGAKSAAVPHPDGTHRRLYCVESPESWFEDFGESELACGQADVAIDPDFAAVIDPTHYQVFLTQYGGHDDLSVTERTPSGFRVEGKNTTSSNRFGWRVVAKRKDIAATRLETVEVPPEPQLPTILEPATAVPPRTTSRRNA